MVYRVFYFTQSPETEDIVSAILYALSTPPRIEVKYSTWAYYVYAKVDIILSLSGQTFLA